MIPIGGKAVHNTMYEEEVLQVVRIMSPKHVTPCHYNCPAFFSKRIIQPMKKCSNLK
jgi:L-ascorbate metabolism protein UlaG (beta-lactamase superfamily)